MTKKFVIISVAVSLLINGLLFIASIIYLERSNDICFTDVPGVFGGAVPCPDFMSFKMIYILAWFLFIFVILFLTSKLRHFIKKLYA